MGEVENGLRALLADPGTGRVSEVRVRSDRAGFVEDCLRMVGGREVAAVGLGALDPRASGMVAWVDGEGLWREAQGYWRVAGTRRVHAGRALVTGEDAEGNPTSFVDAARLGRVLELYGARLAFDVDEVAADGDGAVVAVVRRTL